MQVRKNHASLIFVFLITFYVGWSQEYKFQHLTTVDGLSHNEVRKIVKDDRGFLWFGTQNGLNRFDGYRFKIFKNNPDDSTSIVGDKIYSLTTSKDKLWVGTISGLSVINTVTLEVIPIPKIKKVLGDNSILQLYYDGFNKVWVSTENENFIINTQTLEITSILKDFKIACITKGIDNKYWIGTDKGLLKYEFESSVIVKIYDVGRFNAYSLDKIFSNINGEIWITLSDRILLYQSERDRFIEMFESKSLNAICQNTEGDILFGSYGDGVTKYSRVTGEFKNLKANPENPLSISSDDVYDIYIDNENIIWIGTQEGLDYFDYSRHRFNSLVHLPEKENSLRSSFVQSLYQDEDGTLWIGTREGIDLVEFDEGYTNPQVSHYKITESGFEALNNNYVTGIFKDSKNRIWISSMNNGLFLIDKKKKIFKNFKHEIGDDNSIASSSVRAILEDHLGRIWFGTGGGLSLLKETNEADFSFENFGYSKFNTNSLPLNDIYTLYQDSKHRIWIGMNKGGLSLLKENGQSKSFLRFNHKPTDLQSLSNDEVFVIYEDTKNRVWIGTSGAGLNLLMEDDGKENENRYYFKRYTEKEGLSDNEVNAILEDNNENLWIATNTGFSMFDVANESFTNFSTYDGVLKGKFRKNARWKTKEGIMFFGGAAGINFFDPENFLKEIYVPSPVFSDLLIDGKIIKPGHEYNGSIVIKNSLESGAVIDLPKKDNRFQIEFTSLTFASSIRNQYAYKLEGFDKEWILTSGSNPSARYSKLKPGNYRFLLKASNYDGNWNEKPIYLDIIVHGSIMENNIVKIGTVFLAPLVIFFGLLVFKKININSIHSEVDSRNKKSVKHFDPNLNEENLLKVSELNALMEREKVYLNSELGLSELADKIGVSSNHLSMLLNDCIGKNFYDYINEYRVEEVKKRLVDPQYRRQTLSSIGGDCGFNSKSAFNRIFKNFTKKTPSQYQKMSQNG
ncbi:ligand-binding sensor domain-containing protein [Arenibacter nanhaiticus]|uniref:Ligand-binding sensor domain-containing protein n=1 Tax=Arenibacter nanhaiticus TaxID=558155 RepID=A0A1M6C1A0_9FLAO|nr:ligand-binding sensor domain-containing protein [Arenibacter nanhaiticus]